MAKRYVKDPSAVKDYGIDWVNRLRPGESIVASVWEITQLKGSSDSLSLEGSEIVSGTQRSVFLKLGQVGEHYRVTNRVTTNSTPVARIDDQSIEIQIEHT